MNMWRPSGRGGCNILGRSKHSRELQDWPGWVVIGAGTSKRRNWGTFAWLAFRGKGLEWF